MVKKQDTTLGKVDCPDCGAKVERVLNWEKGYQLVEYRGPHKWQVHRCKVVEVIEEEKGQA